VIDTAHPVFLVAPKEEGSAPVWIVASEQTDRATAIPEGDEVLAQEAHTHGRAIGLGEISGEEKWLPVLPEQIAHESRGTDTREQCVLFVTQHGLPPRTSMLP
jgi:hypothetical protein